MSLKLIKHPHPWLRVPSQPVGRFDDVLSELARQMHELMQDSCGIGLAAVQFGVPIRMIVVGEGVLKDEIWALVNPVVVKSAGEQTSREGCLSISRSEWNKPIKRALRVVVEYQDLTGAKQKIKAHGLLAAVLQHEIDHLDGKLFTDYVKPALGPNPPLVNAS